MGKDDLADIAKRLAGLTAKLTADDIHTLFKWIINVGSKGVATSKIGEVLQTIKKEEENVMKHALEVLFDELREDAAQNRSVEIAKRMIRANKDVNEIVEFSGLDIDDDLKLKGSM